MKLSRVSLLLAAFLFPIFQSASAQNSEFPGVQSAMSPEAFEKAGLNKLSPEERAKLDQFIRGYVSESSEKAATAAVDNAVKTNKVTAPEVIESNIVGSISGYDGRTRFTLQNGQVWAQSQPVSRNFSRLDSPPVIIVKGKSALSGYRMYILGGGNIRVSKIR